jgi:hypothetical membrane protein
MIFELFMSSFKYFGLAGCMLVAFSVAYSALCYTGKTEEHYSILNHFISELGEVGVSKKATVFNSGLILAGISLVPFILGIGFLLDNLWAKLGILFGLTTAISCALVGVFPMNNLNAHVRAATLYFRSGFITVILLTIGILTQPMNQVVVPWYAGIFGGLAVFAYGYFLFLIRNQKIGRGETDTLNPDAISERPRFWLVALVEWMVFFTTLFWFFCIALVVP